MKLYVIILILIDLYLYEFFAHMRCESIISGLNIKVHSQRFVCVCFFCAHTDTSKHDIVE